ncbi:hypothetical protein HPB50_026049 [Hyalomma asiaticum]|uniref:Uncharacterized protein n=1 Tax=Hyalomma asiaticum TaxID=266040 RepID=A0ACB7STJ4_HYAAI|nr:hypothetical protein HPB50_026049 [Hyalomma asiaticum]
MEPDVAHGGARQNACQTLAKAVAVGRILYGAPVYDFSNRDLHDIEKLHRATLRTITGLPKHTRNEDLLRLVPIPPIRDIIREAQFRMQCRLENTPQGKQVMAWDSRARATPVDQETADNATMGSAARYTEETTPYRQTKCESQGTT